MAATRQPLTWRSLGRLPVVQAGQRLRVAGALQPRQLQHRPRPPPGCRRLLPCSQPSPRLSLPAPPFCPLMCSKAFRLCQPGRYLGRQAEALRDEVVLSTEAAKRNPTDNNAFRCIKARLALQAYMEERFAAGSVHVERLMQRVGAGGWRLGGHGLSVCGWWLRLPRQGSRPHCSSHVVPCRSSAGRPSPPASGPSTTSSRAPSPERRRPGAGWRRLHWLAGSTILSGGACVSPRMCPPLLLPPHTRCLAPPPARAGLPALQTLCAEGSGALLDATA